MSGSASSLSFIMTMWSLGTTNKSIVLRAPLGVVGNGGVVGCLSRLKRGGLVHQEEGVVQEDGAVVLAVAARAEVEDQEEWSFGREEAPPLAPLFPIKIFETVSVAIPPARFV